MKDLFKDIIICPYCGLPTKIIWIHGQGQCANCKNVIDECCSGEVEQNKPVEKKIPENKNREINEEDQPENEK